jgi:hypothetical protein
MQMPMKCLFQIPMKYFALIVDFFYFQLNETSKYTYVLLTL